MFVVTPVAMAHPYSCPLTFTFDMEDHILAPLRDDQKIDFMWRTAIALTHKRAFVVVFYGRDGHEGKVCDEVKISDGLSYNNIKQWTSNSLVLSGTSTSLLFQTMIALSNKIPFYNRGLTKNSIGRLVVYHMQKGVGKMPSMSASVITYKMLHMFISMWLSVSEAYANAPPSLPIALYSQFHNAVAGKGTRCEGWDVGGPPKKKSRFGAAMKDRAVSTGDTGSRAGFNAPQTPANPVTGFSVSGRIVGSVAKEPKWSSEEPQAIKNKRALEHRGERQVQDPQQTYVRKNPNGTITGHSPKSVPERVHACDRGCEGRLGVAAGHVLERHHRGQEQGLDVEPMGGSGT
ncbi:hypothetical protein P171DRAFT_449861 [Karstenula rhodostoma CBS 690.94]|uniref:Uncharacterized protein n=1 Tax=Karstenula rhodostoma CBS 690.94 TaxID=1392251 RepID=A0A9P4P5G0_9PLEO|nr:hypothetical protein P171DRAFT_449861 [Karstenula rhodostoma CBS 690.94]